MVTSDTRSPQFESSHRQNFVKNMFNVTVERVKKRPGMAHLNKTTDNHPFQCDQIRQFLKVLDNKFALKSSLKRLLTFGIFGKRSIDVKTALDII